MLDNLFNTIPLELFDKGEILNIDKQTVCDVVKNIWNYVEDRFIDMTVYKSTQDIVVTTRLCILSIGKVRYFQGSEV